MKLEKEAEERKKGREKKNSGVHRNDVFCSVLRTYNHWTNHNAAAAFDRSRTFSLQYKTNKSVTNGQWGAQKEEGESEQKKIF